MTRDEITQMVRALRALATSGNPHEAGRDLTYSLLDIAWGGSLSYHLDYADARPARARAAAARALVQAQVELVDREVHL